MSRIWMKATPIKATIKRPSWMFSRQLQPSSASFQITILSHLLLAKNSLFLIFYNGSMLRLGSLSGSAFPQNLSTLHFHLTLKNAACSQKLSPPKNAQKVLPHMAILRCCCCIQLQNCTNKKSATYLPTLCSQS